jgi:hypothetical protein
MQVLIKTLVIILTIIVFMLIISGDNKDHKKK